jgi:hypothetical protein
MQLVSSATFHFSSLATCLRQNQIQDCSNLLQYRQGFCIFLSLWDLVSLYTPSHSLRSSTDGRLLRQSRYKRKSHGFRSFSFYGPQLWNSLPCYITHSTSSEVFVYRDFQRILVLGGVQASIGLEGLNLMLLFCRSMKSLLKCMDQMSNQIATCPALSAINAIASRQQEQDAFQLTCGTCAFKHSTIIGIQHSRLFFSNSSSNGERKN